MVLHKSLSAQAWFVVAACSYEVAAVTTGRVPTLTALCEQRPWLKRVLVEALAVHLDVGQLPRL